MKQFNSVVLCPDRSVFVFYTSSVLIPPPPAQLRTGGGQCDIIAWSLCLFLQIDFTRLPGLCQRLKRRRVTVLVKLTHLQGRGQKNQSGQVCRCPRGSRCSHFFVHSL
uniref:Uncharacterized protein n=1 Tax=Lates calcarifer TaxID=8187 RepID=A0A4W6DXX9_LATCA